MWGAIGGKDWELINNKYTTKTTTHSMSMYFTTRAQIWNDLSHTQDVAISVHPSSGNHSRYKPGSPDTFHLRVPSAQWGFSWLLSSEFLKESYLFISRQVGLIMVSGCTSSGVSSSGLLHSDALFISCFDLWRSCVSGTVWYSTGRSGIGIHKEALVSTLLDPERDVSSINMMWQECNNINGICIANNYNKEESQFWSSSERLQVQSVLWCNKQTVSCLFPAIWT